MTVSIVGLQLLEGFATQFGDEVPRPVRGVDRSYFGHPSEAFDDRVS
jgi:hypothetical protein